MAGNLGGFDFERERAGASSAKSRRLARIGRSRTTHNSRPTAATFAQTGLDRLPGVVEELPKIGLPPAAAAAKSEPGSGKFGEARVTLSASVTIVRVEHQTP